MCGEKKVEVEIRVYIMVIVKIRLNTMGVWRLRVYIGKEIILSARVGRNKDKYLLEKGDILEALKVTRTKILVSV